MIRMTRIALVLATLLAATPALAQQTTGSIIGRITDEQGAAVPGATVSAGNSATGFSRTTVSDAEGTYRLPALPVGVYDMVVELQGFTRVEHSGVIVNVSRVTDLDVVVRVAKLAETVTVSGESPLVSTSSSGLGAIVDLARIQNLPLNGRQFANLAATVPGVGLGFNSDPTKSTQYTPQISGGNGRNINYLIDGGDNNDDTTGGLLQLFPLEAIEQFNLMTHRFDAEYGRSSGSVLNVVTRSGTNMLRGSWFTLFRDDSLNARTFSEQSIGVDKQPYRRYQYGGSLGGPVVENRMHYFGAFERTQQDTRQPVDTLGLFPEVDGVYDVPVRETMFTGKLTSTIGQAQYFALRYGYNHNTQPNGAGLRHAPESWATSTNDFHSLNANHNWVLGQSALNETVAQYSYFRNEIPSSAPGPSFFFPNGVRAGANAAAPQSTEQQKWQLRNDFTWTVTGAGIGHDIKAGINWIHEPTLRISTMSLFSGLYMLATNSPTGPVREVMQVGGGSSVNMPLDMYGVYVQDDWRATDRLTFNLGVRWDYVAGFPIDQRTSPNFLAMQAAARSGRFDGTVLEQFAEEPRRDRDNIQPRLGAVYDLRGDGRDILRGGWGIYTDFAYTNANVLMAALDTVGQGIRFFASQPGGLRRPDGSFFQVTDSLETIRSLNLINPNAPILVGQVVSPVLEQPYSRQANLGWAHQFGDQTALSADYVRVDARDINVRLRLNYLVNGRRYLAGIPIQPNSSAFRVGVSGGSGQYDALILALRRRLSRGLDLSASYTLSSSTTTVGPAYDELDSNLVQDVTDPFGPVQQGPASRTDARHQVTISAIVQAPWQLQVSPFFMYRSALPMHTIEGIDLNRDGNLVDKTPVAYRFAGLNDDGTSRIEEMGACETINCSRRAPFSQLNLRVSRGFRLPANARIEAIVEIFNVFNARNPFIGLTSQRLVAGAPNPAFMRPSAYAGDVGQGEQRVGQLGFRLTF